MAVIEQEYTLNVVGGYATPLIIHCSLVDGALRHINFKIKNGIDDYEIPDNTKVIFQGTRSDGGTFSYVCPWSGNTVSVNLTEKMTSVVGVDVCEILFLGPDGDRLATANLVLNVENAPLEDSDLSSSGAVQEFINYVNATKYYQDLSKSYAVGEVGVRENENINNAKYYADLAAGFVGTPLTANVASDMTNTEKIYVYAGSESGYKKGYWYFYDGETWKEGGVYNSIALKTDTTMKVPGSAADAKAVGEKYLQYNVIGTTSNLAI